MSSWSRRFGRQARKSLESRSNPMERGDVFSGFQGTLNDAVGGYAFCATMQLRTPSRVLRRHGEIHRDLNVAPPRIAQEQWEGIWIPILEGQQSFFGTMASEVGPIPADGGDYLPFLLAVRFVVESDDTASARRAQLKAMLGDRRWGEFAAKHGGIDSIADRFFPSFLTTVRGLPTMTVAALGDKGWSTPEVLSKVPDSDLLGIGGVGPAKLRAIRAACASAVAPAEQFVDLVVKLQ